MLEGADPHAIVVFGSAVAIVLIVTIGTIIKAWIKKDSGSNIAENREFLAALREFKENMERRVASLEAIVTDEKHISPPKREKSATKTVRKSFPDIEMENDPLDAEPVQKAKLKNMLNQ